MMCALIHSAKLVTRVNTGGHPISQPRPNPNETIPTYKNKYKNYFIEILTALYDITGKHIFIMNKLCHLIKYLL